MQRQLERLGPPPFDAADRKYAAEDPGDADRRGHRLGLSRAPACRCSKDTPLCDFVVPYGTKGAPMMGSTDVGDVSWVVPTVQARGGDACHRHARAFLADHRAGQVRPGQEGHGPCGQGDGGVAVDALDDPALIARAKADHKARTEVTPYDCPLPADVKPPIQPRPGME